MAARRRRPMLGAMNETPLTLTLELRVTGDQLAGTASDADGRRREFLGRLGLMCAIDALVAAGVSPAAIPDEKEIR